MTSKEALFDRRVIDRYRKEGLVTDDQVKEYLKKLPDAADKAESLGSERSAESEPPAKGRGR